MNEARIRDALEYIGVYEPNNCWSRDTWFTHPCPFAPVTHKSCVDRNPSFGIAIVDDNYSYYNCFSCKQTGIFYMLSDSVARVVGGHMGGDPAGVAELMAMELQGLGDLSTPRKIIERKEAPKPLNKDVYETLYDPAWGNKYGREYLEQRGITEGTATRCNLQFDESEMRVIFPVYGCDQNLYGFTGRTVLDNWQDYHNPKENRIYPKVKDYAGLQKNYFMLGEHLIQPGKPTMVVEGLFGYAHLMEIEADQDFNIVAILGSKMSKHKIDTLINAGNAVYLMFDNDEAGETGIFGTDKLKGALDHLINYVPVYVPEWPEGKIDPDQLTKEDIANLLNLTYPYVIH